MKTSGLSVITRIIILTAFYALGGILGWKASFMSGNTALVWPPSGIALAAILLFGYRFWPGVAIGALFCATLSGKPFGFFTLSTAIGNTIGAMVCAFLLERFVQFRTSLNRVRDVAGFVGLACVLGTTVNAAFNVVGLNYSGLAKSEHFFDGLLEWWIPNVMAGLVVTPVILAWGSPSGIHWDRKRITEALVCATGLALGTMISFNSWYVQGIQSYPLAYLPYPFLVWAALRFGQVGATSSTLVISTLAIYALLHGRGPFVAHSERDSLMLLGSYIGILAVTNMFLAAVSLERDRAEQNVREEEKRYRGVVEDQSELIWRFTPDGMLTFVNDAYCRFYRKTREELIGTSFLKQLSLDEDREIPLSVFNSLGPENPVVSFDHRVMSGGGDTIWQQCTIRRLFDERGVPFEFQSIALDITQRKLSEEATRTGEARLRAILDSMVDGVVVVDENSNILMFNPAAEKVFGCHAGKVLGRPIEELFPLHSQPWYTDYLTRYLRRNEVKTIETNALRADGSNVPIDIAMSEVSRGGVTLLIVVVRDISERKKLEEQFRQSQKMEAVGRLAGGIAHDFNNLMQAIIGYTNLVLQRMEANNPHFETIQQIDKSAERAAALTQQLLAFSRKQVLRAKTISLNTVVVDMTKLVQRLIGDNIVLETDLEKPLSNVLADRGQIEQVILNLAINARDAMPQGGTLRIQTASVHLNQRRDGFSPEFRCGPYVRLSIGDTGSGMTPEVKAHIFEPFFTTKEPGKGTGLGLSIVYGVVKQSGGEVLVNSEPQMGTTFEIYLPQHEGVVEEVPQAISHSGESRGSETVLLVEDGDIVRAMLMEVLRTQGYNVLEARDGIEALETAAAHDGPIHLLVTDLMMPNLSGRELSVRLKSIRPDLRMLFISGYSDDEVTRHELTETSADFLQKPFRPAVLLEKVRELLDTSKVS